MAAAKRRSRLAKAVAGIILLLSFAGFAVFAGSTVLRSICLLMVMACVRFIAPRSGGLAAARVERREREIYSAVSRSASFRAVLAASGIIAAISLWAMFREIGGVIPVLSFAIFGFLSLTMAGYAVQYRA